MKYDKDSKLPVGTKVIFIKDVLQNGAKSGMIGKVELNKCFEFTYAIRVNGINSLVPVYSWEIDPYNEFDILDRLTIL